MVFHYIYSYRCKEGLYVTEKPASPYYVYYPTGTVKGMVMLGPAFFSLSKYALP
jgi:hypothetical protein